MEKIDVFERFYHILSYIKNSPPLRLKMISRLNSDILNLWERCDFL